MGCSPYGPTGNPRLGFPNHVAMCHNPLFPVIDPVERPQLMPAIPERPHVHVHLLPALIPPGALKGGIAIVVDVLRATTAMVYALGSGGEAIVPCLEIEEARNVAARLGRDRAILGGERQGLPIEGFDLGNSPGSYTRDICRGKTLVMTTTNGTRAILASREAERTLIAAFSNVSATAEAVQSSGRSIHVVCAGTDGRVSIEDAALAGCLVQRLDTWYEPGNDEAEIVHRLWMFSEDRLREKLPLQDDVLASGRGGKRVRELGLSADIAEAAAIDRFDFVAELRRDPLRIERIECP